MAQLTEEQKKTFMLLRHAVWSGQLCVVPLVSKKTKKPVPVLCIASQPVGELSTEPIGVAPVAIIMDAQAIANQLDLPDDNIGVRVIHFEDSAEGFRMLDYLATPILNTDTSEE